MQADGITEDEAAAKIADVLRYTLCIREDEYAATVKAALQKLTDAGCSVVKFKNTWGGIGYKGINSQLKTPGGYVFELQFHTPESYNAKQEEHKYYEVARDPATSPEERNRLEEISRNLFSQVPVPDGATASSPKMDDPANAAGLILLILAAGAAAAFVLRKYRKGW